MVGGLVRAFGADWVVGNAKVNRLGAVERAEGRELAVPVRPRQCTFRIAEEGDRSNMVSHLWRQLFGDQIDHCRALRISTEHDSGVGAVRNCGLDMSTRIVGSD